MEIKETGLLVIGGGLAGIIASNEAIHLGIKTTVLYTGRGASTDIFGINILGLKRPELKADSFEVFLEDTLKSGCGLNNKDLAETLISNTEGIADTIKLMGLDVNDSRQFSITRPLGCSIPRCVFYNNNKSIGVTLLRYFREQIKDCQTDILNNISITHLLKDKDRIIGAYGFDTMSFSPIIIKAKAIILSTGGFSNIYNFTTTFPTINGGCHAAAYNIGIELVDLEFVQFEPSVCVYPESIKGIPITTTMLNDGAKLYNRYKKVFIKGEYPNKNELTLAMYREIIEGRATENGGLYFDTTILGDRFIETNYPGFIKKYQKGDIDIRKDMLEVAPAAHYCCGGIKIDKNCATNVDGLYACGEITGGIHGANRLGGNAGAETLVFGMIAGKSAADYIKNILQVITKDKSLMDQIKEVNDNLGKAISNKPCYKKIKEEIRKIVSESANIVRDEGKIKDGIKKLSILKEKTYLCISSKKSQKDKFDYFNTNNMITVGQLLLSCAGLRKESRGVHFRKDYPDRDDKNYLKNSVIKKGSKGPKLSFENIV